jgi:hypothetical protein
MSTFCRLSLSLQCPGLYLRDVTDAVDPDVCALYASLQNFAKGGALAALYDSFFQLAASWDISTPDKKAKIEELKKQYSKKNAQTVEANMEKDYMKCRFLDAVYSMQRLSIIKVTNNGKSFQKISSTWVYDDV